MRFISPYISEGSGLKPLSHTPPKRKPNISPYISEGSGLKRVTLACNRCYACISPYISEGSGLKLRDLERLGAVQIHLPLHQ